MSHPVPMPALGEAVTEGTVTQWLKAVGDRVRADEPLVEISTDKVDQEIPAPCDGVLVQIVAHEDDVVEVGQLLAVLDDAPEPEPEPVASAGGTLQASLARLGEAARRQSASPAADPRHAAPAPSAVAPSAVPPMPSPGPEVGGPSIGARRPESRPMPAAPVTNSQPGTGPDQGRRVLQRPRLDPSIPTSPLAGASSAGFKPGGPAARAAAAADVSGADHPSPVAPMTPEAAASPRVATAQAAILQSPARVPAPAASSLGGAQPLSVPAPASQSPAVQAPAASQDAPVSPRASYFNPTLRRLAAEHGVDLAKVQGSGVGGRIRRQDILDAAALAARPAPAAEAPKPRPAPPAAPRGATRVPVLAVAEFDATAVMGVMARVGAQFKTETGQDLTLLPFVVAAVAAALPEAPALAGAAGQSDLASVGFAVDTPHGPLVPVVHDAARIGTRGVARRIASLSQKIAAGDAPAPEDLTGGALTVAPIAPAPVLFQTPRIAPPQVAALAVGEPQPKPVALSGGAGAPEAIGVRPVAVLALAYDPEAVAAPEAARFLAQVAARLESGPGEGGR
ncbi:MAG: 2-oxo acid dehydrogenase subunit E2 [Bifidobacteriaceae bacterium]|jgi:2-oxoglutarate dehydrogenase E2 component (dihydrolipoamide succinyltransferase)|nr:2-oxo acid dehydrogenase subunit E2 [Bifidobacteriaceae bacterium]